jgi:hypothetical protein
MTHALIVIDVQNDFCPNGALAVSGGHVIVSSINALMTKADAVVLTQDWHPEGHSSFASSHADKRPYEQTKMPYGDQVLWPDHCVQGTDGAAAASSATRAAAAALPRWAVSGSAMNVLRDNRNTNPHSHKCQPGSGTRTYSRIKREWSFEMLTIACVEWSFETSSLGARSVSTQLRVAAQANV